MVGKCPIANHLAVSQTELCRPQLEINFLSYLREIYFEIEAVAVSVLWKNGAVTAGCSNTDSAKLALMVLALDAHQRRAFEDGD